MCCVIGLVRCCCCGLVPAFMYISSMAPREELLNRPSSAAVCNCSELPRENYKLIHGQLLSMLDLKASGRDDAAIQGPVTPVLSLGWLSKRSSETQQLGEPLSGMLVSWFRNPGMHQGLVSRFSPSTKCQFSH